MQPPTTPQSPGVSPLPPKWLSPRSSSCRLCLGRETPGAGPWRPHLSWDSSARRVGILLARQALLSICEVSMIQQSVKALSSGSLHSGLRIQQERDKTPIHKLHFWWERDGCL